MGARRQPPSALDSRCCCETLHRTNDPSLYFCFSLSLPTLCMGSDYHGMDSAFQNLSYMCSLNLYYCKQEEYLD